MRANTEILRLGAPPLAQDDKTGLRPSLRMTARGQIAPMPRLFLTLAALSGLISVAAGAFGAHALKDRLEPRLLEVFETAARYQMYHALALCVVAWLATTVPGRLTTVSGWAFLAGTLLFSGSLYAMAFTGIRALGAITPLGGVAFLIGWGALLLAARTLPH
jgi:uncharacterized membrane protein YgdD (TMEM256/DUF423 family)